MLRLGKVPREMQKPLAEPCNAGGLVTIREIRPADLRRTPLKRRSK